VPPLSGRQEGFCEHPLEQSGGLKLFIIITAIVAVNNLTINKQDQFLLETGLLFLFFNVNTPRQKV